MKTIEKRLFLIGTGLVLGSTLIAWTLFGYVHGLSLLAGGTLSALNLAWLRKVAGGLVFSDPRKSKHRILAGYFFRLLLLPLFLYAMIRFLFLSVPAAVAGFAVFDCCIFVEGILEAFGTRSK